MLAFRWQSRNLLPKLYGHYDSRRLYLPEKQLHTCAGRFTRSRTDLGPYFEVLTLFMVCEEWDKESVQREAHCATRLRI